MNISSNARKAKYNQLTKERPAHDENAKKSIKCEQQMGPGAESNLDNLNKDEHLNGEKG